MIKKGFTLAEVLVVIAILGVVAMLTVANVTNNVDSEKNIAIMKSAMGQIDAAIAKIVSEYGTLQKACEEQAEDASYNAYYLGKVLQENMDTVNTCDDGGSDCFSAVGLRNNATCDYAFILSNGVSVCTKSNDTGLLFIDIDGPQKGENRYGSDKFEFTISDDGLGFIENGSRETQKDFQINKDETEWAYTIGNQDYLNCADDLVWGRSETCK